MRDFVAIDIETAHVKRWSICQLGLAIVENGIIKETITELVQPPDNAYSLWNTMIHGLKKEDTLNTPCFPEIWEKLKHKIGQRKLVVHNADFDISCLNETMKYYNMEKMDFDYVCIYEMARQKLNLACNSLGITFSKHHNAERDAIACAKIFLKLGEN
jgi:DNA polymerase III subunit epsilon